MTTRLKKNRKKRGHVSAGHGRIGKLHRKHLEGMRYFHKTMKKFHCPIVNVDRLFSLLPDRAKSALKGKGPLLDVTQFGYFKVLGKGDAPPTPLVVKAKFFSKLAEKKIKEASGAVLLTA
ncbi:hypothetical protein GOP47_0024020 [Adiantum capillus-veneris]|uniref:Large ribosomal subunit protein uL15/eL18 domain-containing protein n=1 Tax=Adiantum capillus-veneris TaxID=13818 RepID=A0A9D4U5M5_ADICA|nr:hypothetical protein GOP47_0024020 [Adiantum capillus-veneris]